MEKETNMKYEYGKCSKPMTSGYCPVANNYEGEEIYSACEDFSPRSEEPFAGRIEKRVNK